MHEGTLPSSGTSCCGEEGGRGEALTNFLRVSPAVHGTWLPSLSIQQQKLTALPRSPLTKVGSSLLQSAILHRDEFMLHIQ